MKEMSPVITAEQYESIAGTSSSSVFLPTPQELFELQAEFWVKAGMALEEEFRGLARFVPKSGLFIVVPARPRNLDYDRLLSLVILDGKEGRKYLNPSYQSDRIRVPEGPYLMLDVEDGRSRVNTEPLTSQDSIASEDRSPYIIFEGISHAALFPAVMRHHFIVCCGSRYKDHGLIPGVCLGHDDIPSLVYDGNEVGPKWGAPSCRNRIALEPQDLGIVGPIGFSA